MTKTIALSLSFAALTCAANGSGIPVVDAAAIAQNAGNQIVNFAKWSSTEIQAVNTQLNTLHQYEQQVLQVARLGNPAALRSLPVVSTVAELYSSGQQVIGEYQQLKSLTNPQYYEGQLQSLSSAYQLQNYNPLTSGYTFPSASYGVAESAQKALDDLEKQRQRLEAKRDQALQSLASAGTASEVAKYHASIDAANGALAEVASREAALANRVQLQQNQLNAGQAVQRQRIIQGDAASFGSGVNSDLNILDNLSTNYGTAPHWPAN